MAVTASCISVHAQPVDKILRQIKFHSFNSVQLLNGNTTTSAAIHSVNGFQFGKFFTGIGMGFDYYYHTSVPAFIEARYDIAGSKRRLQAFVNGGLHFSFSSLNKKQEYKTGPYKNGRLLAAGLDYFIPVKNEALIIGLGYSQKQVIQMVDNNVWNPVLNRVDNIPIKDDYQFNRVWIKLGWMF